MVTWSARDGHGMVSPYSTSAKARYSAKKMNKDADWNHYWVDKMQIDPTENDMNKDAEKEK